MIKVSIFWKIPILISWNSISWSFPISTINVVNQNQVKKYIFPCVFLFFNKALKMKQKYCIASFNTTKGLNICIFNQFWRTWTNPVSPYKQLKDDARQKGKLIWSRNYRQHLVIVWAIKIDGKDDLETWSNIFFNELVLINTISITLIKLI